MVRINKICENQIIENPANMIQKGNQLHDVNSTGKLMLFLSFLVLF